MVRLSIGTEEDGLMDELSFEKTYQDGGLVRLWVSASSGLCGARRGLYEDEAAVRAAAGEVLGYARDFSRGRSVVLGRWEGGLAPALSLRILPADSRGHVTLEVDMEIDDDGDRHAHRARFFVKSELGPVGRLGASLLSLAGGPVGSHATLNSDLGGLPWYMAEGGPTRVGAPLVGEGGILPGRMLGSAVRLGGPGTDRYAWGRDAAVAIAGYLGVRGVPILGGCAWRVLPDGGEARDGDGWRDEEGALSGSAMGCCLRAMEYIESHSRERGEDYLYELIC